MNIHHYKLCNQKTGRSIYVAGTNEQMHLYRDSLGTDKTGKYRSRSVTDSELEVYGQLFWNLSSVFSILDKNYKED